MNGNQVMTLLKTNLAAAMPARVVTRSAKDFAQRPVSEMTKGVITLVALNVGNLAAERDLRDTAGKLNLMLLGEFKLSESATGEQIEVAEWALWDEIDAFLRSPGLGLCPLNPMRLQLSGQADAPYGWIAVELEYSELD